MSVHLEQCTNVRCAHLFEVEQFSKAFGSDFAAGVIECPHCGNQKRGLASLVYITRKMARELESWPEVET